VHFPTRAEWLGAQKGGVTNCTEAWLTNNKILGLSDVLALSGGRGAFGSNTLCGFRFFFFSRTCAPILKRVWSNAHMREHSIDGSTLPYAEFFATYHQLCCGTELMAIGRPNRDFSRLTGSQCLADLHADLQKRPPATNHSVWADYMCKLNPSGRWRRKSWTACSGATRAASSSGTFRIHPSTIRRQLAASFCHSDRSRARTVPRTRKAAAAEPDPTGTETAHKCSSADKPDHSDLAGGLRFDSSDNEDGTLRVTYR
jgi:hypothetical protein